MSVRLSLNTVTSRTARPTTVGLVEPQFRNMTTGFGRTGEVAGRDASGSTTRATSRLRGDRINPLRDPADRRLPRVAGPCVLVMFGVTGDLSRKKLMPAVYDLANRGLLPPGFGLVGFARRDWDCLLYTSDAADDTINV